MENSLAFVETIAAKVDRGERLSFEDGVALFSHRNLLDLARLANGVRERLWGDRTFYNVNLHINPTNACVMNCRFCAFGRKLFDEKAYVRRSEEIVERARALMPAGCTEIHLVGGLDPRLKISFYCEYIRALKEAFPQVHIKTLTPVEAVYIAQVSKLSLRETLERLRDAGMDSMPGGGAEIFAPEIREKICEHKCDAAEWFETHRLLHEMGMRTNCTMLYGHIEEARHRVDHLLRLRDHQDRHGRLESGGGGFQCFIPLPFHPQNTHLSHLPGPSGADDLRTLAVSRLMLDNIPHIKAYWISLGIKTAQMGQWFGADDIDGTVTFEEIYHDAGSNSPLGMTEDRIRELIADAGRRPVTRDSLYRAVEGMA